MPEKASEDRLPPSGDPTQCHFDWPARPGQLVRTGTRTPGQRLDGRPGQQRRSEKRLQLELFCAPGFIHTCASISDPAGKVISTVTEFGCIPVSTVYHTDKFGWVLTRFVCIDLSTLLPNKITLLSRQDRR